MTKPPEKFPCTSEPITGGPILEPQVDEAALKRAVSAEDQAAALSHWQVLDIVYVHTFGSLSVCRTSNVWRPLRELLTIGVLKPSAVRNVYPFLVPGHRFRPVLEALWRSGRVKRPEVANA